MNDIAVITANFGGIDEIRPFPRCDGVDTFYYTDQASLSAADEAAAASWTRIIVPDYPRHDFGPRLRGRYFKHQIHRVPEARAYRWLVWADATVLFTDPTFLVAAAARLRVLPPRQRLMTIPHPDRKTVREEYELIRNEIARGDEYLRIRYGQEKMDEQMAFFAREGMNVNAPLWCGTLWMTENSDLMQRCLDAWWDQNLRFGMMDQLSLPIMLEEFYIEPQPLAADLRNNPYFKWMGHRVSM